MDAIKKPTDAVERPIITAERSMDATDVRRENPPVRRQTELDYGPKVCRIIPLPRNEDVVDRADILARLETLLPVTSEYHSAALCGLGGSG